MKMRGREKETNAERQASRTEAESGRELNER